MKKVLLISLCLITSTLFSQELVGKVQYIKAYESNGSYNIEYRDLKFTHIQVFKSLDLHVDEFHRLFDTINEGFNNEPLESVIIETERDIIRLRYYKAFGVALVEIQHMVSKNENVIGITKSITKKQAIKLFGKR